VHRRIADFLRAGCQAIISSGYKVPMTRLRQRFIVSHDAKHRIAMDGDSKAMR
jgi:hypothetical protein